MIDRVKAFIFFLCVLVFAADTRAANLSDSLMPIEKEWLMVHAGEIFYTPNPSWPPYDYIEAGIHKGIVSDYMDLIEAKLGVKFGRKHFSNWDEILQALKAGEADFNGSMQSSKEQEEFMVFTDSYAKVPLVALVRDNFTGDFQENLNAYRCMSVNSYASNHFIKNEYGIQDLKSCDDDLQGLLAVSFGSTDVFFTDVAVATYYLEKYSINNLKILFELPIAWNLRFGFTKKNEGLRDVFQKILMTIPSDEKDRIYRRHIFKQPVISSLSFWDKYYRVVYVLIGSAFILLISFLLIYYRLRQMVRKKTALLENELKKNKEASLMIKANERRLESLVQLSQYTPESINDLWAKVLTHAIELSESHAGFVFQNKEKMKAMELLCEKGSNRYPSIPRIVFIDANPALVEILEKNQPHILEYTEKNKSDFPFLFDSKNEMEIEYLLTPIYRDSNEVLLMGLFGRKSGYTDIEKTQSVLLFESAYTMIRNYSLQEQLFDAKKAAEASESFKSVFLANVGHDIKTPLNSIMGFADLLMNDHPSNSNVHKYASVIYRSSGHLRDMVQDLLTLSAIQSGKSSLQNSEVGIREMVDELSELFEYQSKNTKVKYSVYISENIPDIILIDEGKLRQILQNLIGNAFKFTEDGSVKLSVEFNGIEIIFSVSDTGIGIQHDRQSMIFDRYTQADDNIVKTFGGSGLGLAIVKSYSELMGGRLWLESEPGYGSTFSFAVKVNEKQVSS